MMWLSSRFYLFIFFLFCSVWFCYIDEAVALLLLFLLLLLLFLPIFTCSHRNETKTVYVLQTVLCHGGLSNSIQTEQTRDVMIFVHSDLNQVFFERLNWCTQAKMRKLRNTVAFVVVSSEIHPTKIIINGHLFSACSIRRKRTIQLSLRVSAPFSIVFEQSTCCHFTFWNSMAFEQTQKFIIFAIKLFASFGRKVHLYVVFCRRRRRRRRQVDGKWR